MRKTNFGRRAIPYSVAMSQETGCIVMLRDGKVMGSLDREQSIAFAEGIIDWQPTVTQAVAQALDG